MSLKMKKILELFPYSYSLTCKLWVSPIVQNSAVYLSQKTLYLKSQTASILNFMSYLFSIENI